MERTLVLALVRDLDLCLKCNSALTSNLQSAFNYVNSLAHDLVRPLARALELAVDCACKYSGEIDCELQDKLYELKAQLPDQKVDLDTRKEWWQFQGQIWNKQLRMIMIEHRNIGHDWQFTDSQKQLLQQYYDANKLLVDCLNSDCYISRKVRQEIEDTLLLPMSEIQQRMNIHNE